MKILLDKIHLCRRSSVKTSYEKILNKCHTLDLALLPRFSIVVIEQDFSCNFDSLRCGENDHWLAFELHDARFDLNKNNFSYNIGLR